MLNANRVTELREQLAVAEQDAKPVIVEKTEDNKDKTVYTNRTSGTVRTDLRGGEPVEYEERPPVPPAEVPFCDRPVEAAVGKIVLVDDSKRVIDLTSGTKRTDLR